MVWGVLGLLGAIGHYYVVQTNGGELDSPTSFGIQVILSVLLIVSSVGFKKRSVVMTKIVGTTWVALFLSMAVTSFIAYQEFQSLGPFLGLALFAVLVVGIIKGLFSKDVRMHLSANAI